MPTSLTCDILTCYILVGLPGSGKSTLAQKIVEHDPHYRIVSTDQIRATLYGDESIQGPWPEIETVVLSQIRQALAASIPIVYDATNYKQADRIDLMQKLAHHPNICWVVLHLITSVEQCKQWNRQRDRQVDAAVIDTMAQHLQQYPPRRTEGFAMVEQILPQELEEIATVLKRINGPT